VTDEKRGRDHLALAGVLALVAAVLIALGRRYYIGYDSYWHVFIARQDRWPNFWQEILNNAHPPLFYLLLRASWSWFGSHLIVYRAVSIASTVAGAWLVGAIVQRTTCNRGLGIVAAAGYGLSFSAVTMGLEVRSYALCAAFTLAALYFYLDWLDMDASLAEANLPESSHPHILTSSLSVPHTGFALTATAAVLSHYSTFFFLGGVFVTTVILGVGPAWRRRIIANVRSHPLATAVMFGIPVATAATAYYVHVVLWAGGRLNHVPEYMFTPVRESPAAFVVRNSYNLTNVLLPGGDYLDFPDWRKWLALVIVGLITAVGLARLRRTKAPRLVSALLVLFTVMLVANAAAGLADRYPFGGTLRHEFFLVAFAVALVFTLFDVAVGPRRSGVRESAWLAAASSGVAASVLLWTWNFPFIVTPLAQGEMERFNRVVPAPQAVLVGQFTLINFFLQHDGWNWKLIDEWKSDPVLQTWSVERAGHRIILCRAGAWSMNMEDVVSYTTVEECRQKAHTGRVALFQTQWNLERPAWDTSKTGEFVRVLSDRADLTPVVFESNGGDVFAEFAPLENLDELNACQAPPAPPHDLHVVSNSGRAVVLSWDESGTGRTSYTLEAGHGPGQSDVVNLNLGRMTTFKASGVAPATYYARVRGKNACGTSDQSNEIIVVVQ